MIPSIIEELIKDLEMVEITDFHRSGDLVYSIGNKYILKISEELTRLQQEFEKDTWVSNHIKSGKPIVFIIENNKAFYLREYLEGENLVSPKYLNNPLKLIDLLVEGLNLIHNTKVASKEYILDDKYETLIHGDYCLPNILVKNDKINNLDELEEIIKKKGGNGLQLCLRCLHVTNEICNRCDDPGDQGFRFRYKYYKNRMDEENNPKDDFVFIIK